MAEYDEIVQTIADYVYDYPLDSVAVAFDTARLCLADSLGCAALALTFPACTKLLGPWISDTTVKFGARVPGSKVELDPIKAAFDIGTLIRWLDYNDTWLAKEWGHPSDNLGAILSVTDFVSRRSSRVYTIQNVLDAMIRAYEIQGILALTNSFNEVGLDHVVLVKLASSALATKLMGGTKDKTMDAITQVFVDGQSLRTYRHAPNVGSRKSWAAGDAGSRGVRLAMLTLQGEQGYPTAISAKRWGFSDVSFHEKPIQLERSFGSYVMENILFKVAYPAEFHAQTAVECAFILRQDPRFNFDKIQKITIDTQQSAIRIICKEGPLRNPADRDHCLQYMVAYALLHGELTADAYEDKAASDPHIDQLREKMQVVEEPQFSRDYLDPNKRSIANRLTIEFSDKVTLQQTCEYPLGHKKRRHEGIPLIWEKFRNNCEHFYTKEKAQQLYKLMKDDENLLKMPVPDFMEQW